MTPPKLYFRCLNFRVEVSLVQQDGLSDIESHVLKTVHAGFDSLDEVREILGLPLRMSMETVNGMLRRNLLVVNFASGRFRVPAIVQEAMEGHADWQLALSGGQQYGESRPVILCLNRFTGTVSSARALAHIDSRKKDPPEVMFPATKTYDVGDLGRAAVINCVNGFVRAQGLVVRDLDLASAVAVREGGVLGSAFAAEWGDGDDDAMVGLQFPTINGLGGREVAAMEALVLATRTSEGHQFLWRSLEPRTVVGATISAHESLRYLPESPVALARSVAAGPETPSADVVARILARVRAMIESVSCVTPQIGAAAVVDAAAALVAGARRQAVLVGPFLAATHAEALLAEAGDAKVGVVWGIAAEPEPADREQAAAMAEHAAVIVDGGGGVSVHAKVAVEDGRRVLVTSKNFLSSGPGSPLFDVGVTLEGGPAVAEALAWVNAIASEDVVARLRWTPRELPRPVEPSTGYPVPPAEAYPPTFAEMMGQIAAMLPVDAFAGGAPALVVAATAWWEEARRDATRETPATTAEELAAFIEDIDRRLDGGGHAPCRLVETDEHRPLMFDALERAERFVVVTSHQLGRRPLGPNWRRALTDALDRGVDVVLVWGESDEDASTAQTALLQQLRELAADRPGRLLINSAPADVHCKLLLIDGLSAVVSSFEFLHFMNSHEYIRHELGVWVGSARVTGAIAAGLVAHIEGSDNAFAAELRALVDDHERAER